MKPNVELLKETAENGGIESLTYEEQARIARHLLDEQDVDTTCAWFEARFEPDYRRERTEEWLDKLLDLDGGAR